MYGKCQIDFLTKDMQQLLLARNQKHNVLSFLCTVDNP